MTPMRRDRDGESPSGTTDAVTQTAVHGVAPSIPRFTAAAAAAPTLLQRPIMNPACLLLSLAAATTGCIYDASSCGDSVAKVGIGAYAPEATQSTSITRIEVDDAGKVLVHVRAADGTTRTDTYRVKARREELY